MQIKEFLREEGIEERSHDDVYASLAKQVGTQAATFYRLLRSKGMPIDELPVFYDLFQSLPEFMQVRESFLNGLCIQLDELSERFPTATVMDAGCASGIDLCFLATRYQDGQMNFKGYDVREGSVERARSRALRRGLSKCEFYMSDHARPQEQERETADLLYAKMCTSSNSGFVDDIAREIRVASRRLREGGTYIIGLTSQEDASPLTALLADSPLHFVRTEEVCKVDAFGRMATFNHIYKMKS
jgi:SAM-dependent methyltransferase